jgi:hypothetical protein
MVIKGFNTRESRTLTFRMGDPSMDVDSHGNPVDNNYIVIINRKDCKYVVKNGTKYIDSKGVKQAVVLGYGGTFYGYGVKTLKKSKYPKYIKTKFDGRMVTEWYESRFYAVKDGRVYTTTQRSFVSLDVQRESRLEELLT